MCFHTSQTKKVKELESRFKVKLSNERYRPTFNTPAFHLNGFAHPNMLVIPQEKEEVLAPGVWGIAPSHTKPEDIKAYYKEAIKYGGGLNAQSEKLFQHFIYKQSVFTRRCIIPVTGFFEPHEHENKKYPYYIHRTDNDIMALAGIYTVIGKFITFSILTKEATPIFAHIHNKRKRQPIILPKDLERDWLTQNQDEIDIKDIISTKYPDQDIEAYSVSKELFSPKVDSNVATIIDKVEYLNLTSK